jgi:hypothetical protein
MSIQRIPHPTWRTRLKRIRFYRGQRVIVEWEDETEEKVLGMVLVFNPMQVSLDDGGCPALPLERHQYLNLCSLPLEGMDPRQRIHSPAASTGSDIPWEIFPTRGPGQGILNQASFINDLNFFFLHFKRTQTTQRLTASEGGCHGEQMSRLSPWPKTAQISTLGRTRDRAPENAPACCRHPQ